VTVERCVHVADAGAAIHPQGVAGQVHGGTLQALGWALWEHVPRAGGAVEAPSLSTTIIPTSMDAPEIETVIVEVPYAGGPFGAKGIGELPMDGPAAAAANAVEAALGIAADEVPLLPEVLHRLRGSAP
jgi:CO/xanthine dehydrogenase Mo-binding subunit